MLWPRQRRNSKLPIKRMQIICKIVKTRLLNFRKSCKKHRLLYWSYQHKRHSLLSKWKHQMQISKTRSNYTKPKSQSWFQNWLSQKTKLNNPIKGWPSWKAKIKILSRCVVMFRLAQMGKHIKLSSWKLNLLVSWNNCRRLSKYLWRNNKIMMIK